MIEFKSGRHEKAFQSSYARQHLKWDLSVCLLGWMMWVPVMFNLYNHYDIRNPSWHCLFLILFTSEKVCRSPDLSMQRSSYRTQAYDVI
jgi:hypothetical protein